MKKLILIILLISPFPGAAVASSCMYNPATQAMQTCLNVTADGRCAHYGSPCGASKRAGLCMYNPATRGNAICLNVTADGRCAHYGSPC